MNIQRLIAFLSYLLFISCCHLYAQPSEQFIKVVVAPDHTNWEYTPGESVVFTVSVLQNGNLLKNTVIRYELGPEKMPATKKDSLMVASGTLSVKSAGLKTPGFLRLIAYAYVDGKQYRGLATAGFEPTKITPTAISFGKSKPIAKPNARSGIMIKCPTTPSATSFGLRNTSLKSDADSVNPIPNMTIPKSGTMYFPIHTKCSGNE